MISSIFNLVVTRKNDFHEGFNSSAGLDLAGHSKYFRFPAPECIESCLEEKKPEKMPRSQERIFILGAGLAGLSCAYHLGTGFNLCEAGAWPGGLCTTTEEEGFRFDKTGHLLHLRTDEMKDLVSDLLEGDLLSIERRSRIYSNGVLTKYPFQANTFGLPPAVARECLMGFLEAHFGEKKKKIRNFEDFILSHFGPGIAGHFMIPYNSRLWGVHPREITAEWCSRFVPVPSLEEVVSGAVGYQERELGYNATFLYPKKGIGALPNALAQRVPQTRYRSRVKAIDWKKKRVFCGRDVYEYEALVSTMPLDRLISVMDRPPAVVVKQAEKLRCNPLRYLDIALKKRPGLDLHWIYVPEERFPFYRVGCYSNFSKDLAPRGKGSLYVELASRKKMRRDRLMPKVIAGLKEIGLIRGPGDIVFSRLRKMDHAYVVYDHNYYATTKKLNSFLAENNIFSIGRYGRWEYSAMEDALLQGKETALKLQEIL